MKEDAYEMYVGRHKERNKRAREEAEFVKVKRTPGTGEGEHSLKTYSLLRCSEAWKKRGEKMD